MRVSRFVVAAIMIAACGGKVPGGGSIPGKDKVPGGGEVPSVPGGASGEVDPNTCGNYAATDAGRKLHDFLVATKEVQKTAQETANVVKESCVMMGKELGMSDADLGDKTDVVCNKVWTTIKDNMKVSLKAKAGWHIKITPAVCKVNVDAEAEAAAKCEGKATADVGASCSGACHGRCDGTCAANASASNKGGGASGECNGQCSGTCHGSCEGHADVKAEGQCKASAQVHASADVQCSDPKVDVGFDAKLVVDKTKAEQTLKALQVGLPKIFSVKARLDPLQAAVQTWATSAKELKDMGPRFANSFKDQATCILGQVGAAANAVADVQVNVSVSVSVSAEAGGSVGG